MQDWKSNVRLSLSDLDKYSNTEEERAVFAGRFKLFVVVFIVCAVLNMVLMMFRVHEAIIFGLFTLSCCGLFAGVKYANTGVICKKCRAPMTRHFYTNGKEYFRDGEVYICHSCESKFISLEPLLKD